MNPAWPLIFVMAISLKSLLISLHLPTFLITLFCPLFLRNVAALLTSSDCRWPDGTDANGRIPCSPDAERSPCCLESEVCLENNLCFGGIGLIYRSACAGGWGDDETCPDFCNEFLREFDEGCIQKHSNDAMMLI